MPDGPILHLGIDATGAQQGAEQFKRATDTIGNSAKFTEQELKQAAKTIFDWDKALTESEKASRDLNSSIGQLKRTLAELNSASNDNFFSMAKMANQAKETQKSFSDLSSASRSMLAGFAGGAAYAVVSDLVQAIQQIPTAFIDAANASIRLENQLRVATGSIDGAQVAFGRLYEIAQRFGTPIEALSTLYNRINISSRDLGMSQTDLMKVVEGVAGSLRISGEGAAQAHGALVQLSQAFGGSKLQAQEFNSIVDSLRPLMQAAAKYIDGAGGSLSKFQELVKEGRITVPEFAHAIYMAANDINQQVQSMAETTTYAAERMHNAWIKLAGALDQQLGITEKVKAAYGGLASVMDAVSQRILASQGNLAAEIKQQEEFIKNLENSLKSKAEAGKATTDFLRGIIGEQGTDILLQLNRSLEFRGTKYQEEKLEAAKQRLYDLRMTAESFAAEQENLTAGVQKQNAEQGTSIRLQQLNLQALQAQARATEDLTIKKRALIAEENARYKLAQEQADNDKKLQPDEAQQVQDALLRRHQAELARIDQEIKRQQDIADKRGQSDFNKQLNDSIKLAHAAEKATRDLAEANAYMLRLEQQAAGGQGEELEKIAIRRQQMLNELDKQAAKVPENARADFYKSGQLNIEAIGAQDAQKYSEGMQREFESQQSQLSALRIRALQAQAGLTESLGLSSKEAQDTTRRIQLAILEERRNAEIASIQESADRFGEAEDFKRQAILLTNQAYDAQRQEMMNVNDDISSSIRDVGDSFRNFTFTAVSGFQEAIVKGESLSKTLQGLAEDFIRVTANIAEQKLIGGVFDLAESGITSLMRPSAAITGPQVGQGPSGNLGGYELAGTSTYMVAEASKGAIPDLIDALFGPSEKSAAATTEAANKMGIAGDDLGKQGAAGDLTKSSNTWVQVGQAIAAAVTGSAAASGASSGISGLLSGLFGLFGGGTTPAYGTTGAGGMVTSAGTNPGFLLGGVAKGGVFLDGEKLQEFALGGIVNRPMYFPMARGAGLMGEAGPEAVIPLKRMSSGKLGVETSGSQDNKVVNNISIINNHPNAGIVQSETANSSGGRDLTIIIDAVKNAVAGDLSRRGTDLNRAVGMAINPTVAR